MIKTRKIAVTTITVLMLFVALFAVEQHLTQVQYDNADHVLETIQENPTPGNILPRFVQLYEDEDGIVYYQDTRTDFVHKTDRRGHIEDLPMTGVDGDYLTYEDWASIHPTWHY